jgi:hypothetical protein
MSSIRILNDFCRILFRILQKLSDSTGSGSTTLMLSDKHKKNCRPTCTYCSAMADKKRYKALKSLETKDTKGIHFITAEELKVRNKERKKNQTNPAVKVRNRLGTFGLLWDSFKRRRHEDPCVKARNLQ